MGNPLEDFQGLISGRRILERNSALYREERFTELFPRRKIKGARTRAKWQSRKGTLCASILYRKCSVRERQRETYIYYVAGVYAHPIFVCHFYF